MEREGSSTSSKGAHLKKKIQTVRIYQRSPQSEKMNRKYRMVVNFLLSWGKTLTKVIDQTNSYNLYETLPPKAEGNQLLRDTNRCTYLQMITFFLRIFTCADDLNMILIIISASLRYYTVFGSNSFRLSNRFLISKIADVCFPRYKHVEKSGFADIINTIHRRVTYFDLLVN